MNPKNNSSELESKGDRTERSRNHSQCFACGKSVPEPKEDNRLGEEIICDSCREEMVASLEEAWVKHSAFLDSALN